MKTLIVVSILWTGLFAFAPAALTEQFSGTPKQETMAEAIRFEKYKIAAAETQAKKEKAEAAKTSRAAQDQNARAKRTARREFDSTKPSTRQRLELNLGTKGLLTASGLGLLPPRFGWEYDHFLNG
jgi:hypothetical protein